MAWSTKRAVRRTILVTGLGAGAGTALTLFGRNVATGQSLQASSAKRPGASGNRAFGRTREDNLRADDTSLPPRARALIRIGEDGIARENRAAMAAFFHPQFRFHGPVGAELDRDQLWAYFASCRAAFDDFTVTRQALVSDGGDYMAARTRFAGLFVRSFIGAPEGTIEPNGKRFEYRIVNIFRYAPDGRLAEEWAQYDTRNFIDQLRR